MESATKGSASPTSVPTKLVSIDDDSGMTALIHDVLAGESLEIRVCNDPVEGLDLVLRWKPQIALLDLMMPKMNGIELMDRILDALPDTNVILLTGNYTP